jgi:hypothetical protein
MSKDLNNYKGTPLESEFKMMLDTLSNCFYQMSNEEVEMITKLYNKAFCSVDLLYYIEHNSIMDDLKKYESLITFQKIKREFRNEKLLMLFILYFLIFRSDLTLENISFM